MGTSYWNFQFSPVLESSRHVDFQKELRIDRVKLGCKFTTDRLPKVFLPKVFLPQYLRKNITYVYQNITVLPILKV